MAMDPATELAWRKALHKFEREFLSNQNEFERALSGEVANSIEPISQILQEQNKLFTALQDECVRVKDDVGECNAHLSTIEKQIYTGGENSLLERIVRSEALTAALLPRIEKMEAAQEQALERQTSLATRADLAAASQEIDKIDREGRTKIRIKDIDSRTRLWIGALTIIPATLTAIGAGIAIYFKLSPE